MIAAMGWDGVTSYAGMRTTTNDLRLLTGLLAGFALNVIIIPMLNDSLWRDSSPGRVLDPGWRLGAWLACVPIAFGAVKWGGPLLGVGYPVLVSIAIFVTLICVNMVMICLTPWFDRKAVRLLDAWPSIALGLLAAILEIGLAGLFRIGINLIALRFL